MLFTFEVVCLTPFQIAKIEVGNVHNVALTTDGRVLLWGIYRDSSGSLGMDPKNDKAEPVRYPKDITSLLSERIVDISCGAEHTLLLSDKVSRHNNPLNRTEKTKMEQVMRLHWSERKTLQWKIGISDFREIFSRWVAQNKVG